MLVNNFSIGIIGLGMILFSFFVLPWGIYGLTWILQEIVNPLSKHHALSVTSLFVEPAKPLFLNNAINHGVFTPLGMIDVADHGSSPLFYIESNPGPGFGLLMAYVLMDKQQRGSAASASVIQFFGGIHEVYFPFVIMRPILLVGTTLANAVGIGIIQIFGAAATAPASPGSIIALFTVCKHTAMAYAGLALSVVASAATSFVICSLLMKFSKKKAISEAEAIAKMNANKGKKSKYVHATVENTSQIESIIFACDAGMGSSAMGAGMLRKMVKEAGLNIKVTNIAIRNLSTVSPDLVVVQSELSERAKQENSVQQFVVENFLEKSQYEELMTMLKANSQVEEVVESSPKPSEDIQKASLLAKYVTPKSVVIGGKAKTIKGAIDGAGKLLVENKYVKEAYIKSMHARNADVSVYIGNGVAIPHGQSDAQKDINKSGISITTYPKGIKWGDETVYLVIGIAGKGSKHMDIISELAVRLETLEAVKELAISKNVKELKGKMQ